jgi:ketosteroid isomerase-like protein
MTARPYDLVLVALSLVAACAPRAAAPATATQADTAAVNDLRQQEVTAVSTGDTALAYMADDILMMPPNEPAVVGIPAARAWFGGFLRQFRASLSYPSTKVVFAGDLAVEQYVGTLTLTPLAGGQPTTEVFKGLHVYRRDAGGVWKMVQDIWNSDTAPAPVR